MPLFFLESDSGFPNPLFAWCYYATLILILVIASYYDLRYLLIPKPLSIGCLALGISANIARGLWIGIENSSGAEYFFPLTDATVSPWLVGLSDGALCALTGFATGFTIFFVMWILGLTAGGDVKLFAAVATWLGVYNSFYLWVGSVLTQVIIALVRLLLHTLLAGAASTRKSFFRSEGKVIGRGMKAPRRRLLPYSLPLAIAAVIMLLWFFRVGLQLVPARVSPNRNAMTSVQQLRNTPCDCPSEVSSALPI